MTMVSAKTQPVSPSRHFGEPVRKHQPARLLLHAFFQRRARSFPERGGPRLEGGDLDAVRRLPVRAFQVKQMPPGVDDGDRALQVVYCCRRSGGFDHPEHVRGRHLRLAAHAFFSRRSGSVKVGPIKSVKGRVATAVSTEQTVKSRHWGPPSAGSRWSEVISCDFLRRAGRKGQVKHFLTKL
jgi:hypothetical protein